MPRGTEYDELWLSLEGSWIDVVVSPKGPWDLRRPNAELVKELFELRPLLPVAKPLPAPLDETQFYLIEKIKDSRFLVDQFEKEANARAELTHEAIHEIDYQITKAASSLDQFTHWGIGYNTGVDVKRNLLERELSNLRRERRTTLLRAWEDITRLRSQFREALAEYKALLNRLGLL